MLKSRDGQRGAISSDLEHSRKAASHAKVQEGLDSLPKQPERDLVHQIDSSIHYLSHIDLPSRGSAAVVVHMIDVPDISTTRTHVLKESDVKQKRWNRLNE